MKTKDKLKNARHLVEDLIFSEGQKRLKEDHGTPAEFAVNCYRCVPEFISMEEAQRAIQQYQREWNEA